MANLHAHANVWETCAQLLERRNYRLHVELGVDDDDPCVYWAERDGFTFSAWNPIELLGLTSIHEDVRPAEARPYWWSANTKSREGERVEERLKREAYAKQETREAELAAMSREELATWWKEYESVRDTAARLGVRTALLEPRLRELGILT